MQPDTPSSPQANAGPIHEEPPIEPINDPAPAPIREPQINQAEDVENRQQQVPQLQIEVEREIAEVQPAPERKPEKEPEKPIQKEPEMAVQIERLIEPQMAQAHQPIMEKYLQAKARTMRTFTMILNVLRQIVQDIAPQRRISGISDYFRSLKSYLPSKMTVYLVLSTILIVAAIFLLIIVCQIENQTQERISIPQKSLPVTTKNTSIDTGDNFTHQSFEAFSQLLDVNDLPQKANQTGFSNSEIQKISTSPIPANQDNSLPVPSKINQDPKIPNSSPYGQLMEKDSGFLINEIIKKYIAKHEEIKKIEEIAFAENSYAIRIAKQQGIKQLTARPTGYKFNLQGKLVQDYESSPMLIFPLELFPITDVKLTSPYRFPHLYQHLMLAFLPVFYSIENGWELLHKMLRGEGIWDSSGQMLTVGSYSYGVEDGSSDFNLFVPTVFVFEFPWNMPEDAYVIIKGMRVNYDLYLRKESFAVECLHRFEVNVSEMERRDKLPVKRTVYCESLKCNSLFSLITIVSNYAITLHSFRIDSILSIN